MHPGDDGVYGTDLVPLEDVRVDLMTPVERWRFNAFIKSGFDPMTSIRLSISRADVHDVSRALENGCSHELALEIFV